MSETGMRYTEAQQRLVKVFDRATSTLITFAGPETPNFGNWTKQALIDEAATLGEAKRRLETAEKTLKEVLKTKLDEGQLEGRGDIYSFTITNAERYALDQGLAKAALERLDPTGAELKACMKSSQVPTMRFKEL